MAAHLAGMEYSESASLYGLDPMIDVAELARYLGIPISTVYDWRTRGLGPRAHRFGKHLKFALCDVQEWIGAQREAGPAPRR